MMNKRVLNAKNFTAAALICLIASLFSCDGNDPGIGPIKIGVMLPMSGSYELGYEYPLEWAKENINAAGGINGRRLQLVYEDL